jgi:hypothetical protein
VNSGNQGPKLIAQAVGMLMLLWLVYQVWPLIVASLTILGAHVLLQQWRGRGKHKR